MDHPEIHVEHLFYLLLFFLLSSSYSFAFSSSSFFSSYFSEFEFICIFKAKQEIGRGMQFQAK
jgi:hypothetical protein